MKSRCAFSAVSRATWTSSWIVCANSPGVLVSSDSVSRIGVRRYQRPSTQTPEKPHATQQIDQASVFSQCQDLKNYRQPHLVPTVWTDRYPGTASRDSEGHTCSKSLALFL